jgi:hypothetical protein
MISGMKMLMLVIFALGSLLAQKGASPNAHTSPGWNPPNQAERMAITNEDHKKNVADAATLLQLAAQLKSGIESETTQTVSVTTVKEAEQIEKLAHGIRNRLKH